MKHFKTSFAELYAGRSEPENLQPLAQAFWRFLLVSAVVIFAASCSFAVWEYSSVTNVISEADTNNVPKVTALDTAKLDALIASFNERARDFETAKGIRPAMQDPSI